ncbi:hypothetical protein ABFO59_06265 [Acinetobacter radioresistens]|uniref:hypothetical protein n=1 Tax=Acinetobacter radioresistens TaxID=40216 RepID=UPI003214D4A2
MASLDEDIDTKVVLEEFNSLVERVKVSLDNIYQALKSDDLYDSEKEKIVKIVEIRRALINNEFYYKEISFFEYLLEETVNIIGDLGQNKKGRVAFSINDMYEFVERYLSIKEKFGSATLDALSDSMIAVEKELSSFRRLRNIADTALTENIYNNAVTKYKNLQDTYRKCFYSAIIITLIISVLLFISKNLFVPSLMSVIEFWVLKITIIIVGITLISYYLKQSSHYQKMADQNYQTQIELQALPSFISSIPINEAANIRKELALKYFGRELEGSNYKDMGNLISDQMKSTTEMVKATTDVLKNTKGNSSA